MSARRRLPNKRPGVNVEIAVGAIEAICTVSLFPDGSPGEIFLEVGKPGSEIDKLARDAACLWSLARQYGAPAEVLALSLARLEDGKPATIIGAAADLAASCVSAMRLPTEWAS